MNQFEQVLTEIVMVKNITYANKIDQSAIKSI